MSSEPVDGAAQQAFQPARQSDLPPVRHALLTSLPRERHMRPFEGLQVIDATHLLTGPFATYRLRGTRRRRYQGRASRRSRSEPRRQHQQAAQRPNIGTSYLPRRRTALDHARPEDEADRELLEEAGRRRRRLRREFAPRRVQALGLAAGAGQDRPRLILPSFSAFSTTARAADGQRMTMIQATSGVVAMTATKDVHSVKLGSPIVDYSTA